MTLIKRPYRRIDPPARQQSGAAAIETALTLPLIMACLFGGLNFGAIFYNKSVLANASREAARNGIVFKLPARATPSEITATASRFKPLLISFDPSSAGSFTVVVDAPAVPVSGDTLNVTVNYHFMAVARGMLPGLGNGIWLNATTTMTYE